MTDVPFDLPGDERELDLTPDRLPRSLWLAAGLPIFAAMLVFWLRGHWQELSYRGYANDPDWLWRRNAYNEMVRGILSFLVFEMWLVVYGLAYWFGLPRTDDREARFNVWVANAWAMALGIPAIQFGTTLDLSWGGMATCLAMIIVGYGGLVLVSRRLARQALSMVAPAPWCYFDWNDPALGGPRGLNLGNPWLWALFAAGLLPSVVTYMLFRFQLP